MFILFKVVWLFLFINIETCKNKMSLVKLLGSIENFEDLKQEVIDIASKHLTDQNQINIQNLTGQEDDWYCGIGSALKLQNSNERDYKFIQPSLKGSVIESVLNKYGSYRARIMNMRPRSCYSLHSDFSGRIHIPIITNTQCWMVWPLANECYNLEEGKVYFTDTRYPHSAFNGSEQNRLHIVMCVYRS
jgi:hypothetical protein